jgi:hypothetical protein
MKVFNPVLLCISNWFQANQLTSIKKKTSNIHSYHILTVYANQALTELETIKFLGLHLDNHLTWQPHLKLSTSQIGHCLLCYKIIPLLHTDAIMTAHYAFFPH